MSNNSVGRHMRSEREQFDELLPWYVNDSLDAGGRVVVDDFLDKHPEAMQELRFYQRMRETMKRRVEHVSPDVGLSRALARLGQMPRAAAPQPATAAATVPTARAAAAPAQAAAPTPVRAEPVAKPAAKPAANAQPKGRKPGLLEMLFGGSWMKPALAFSACVIVGQAAFLVHQQTREDTSIYRGNTPSVPATTENVYLRVMFKPSATEGEIRLLLASTQAWVAGGPGLTGEYFLRFSPERVQAAQDTLLSSGVATEVTPVASIPGAPY
jgi:hypothetical protein